MYIRETSRIRTKKHSGSPDIGQIILVKQTIVSVSLLKDFSLYGFDGFPTSRLEIIWLIVKAKLFWKTSESSVFVTELCDTWFGFS